MSNPFAELGLTPGVLKGLSHDQVWALVKTQFRCLQGLFHPDKNPKKGAERKSQKINEAYETINLETNPLMFEFHLERYLKKKADRITDLEEELNAQGNTESQLRERFLSFLLQDQESTEMKTALNFTGTLKVRDYAQAANYLLDPLDDQKAIFFDLVVEKDRIIRLNSNGTRQEYRRKRIAGTILEKTYKDPKFLSPRRVMDLVRPSYTLLQDSYRRAHLYSERGGRYKPVDKEIIPLDTKISPSEMTCLLHLLTPFIQPQAMLFTINQVGDEVFFLFEGVIRYIESA